MNDKIKIKNELSEKEFTILFSFEFDNHNYITYTDYEKDENGNILCFSSIYDNDKLMPVNDEKALDMIDEILNHMVEETKNKFIIEEDK
ncbi:MAG: DUF1292 domain-containing protein [Firmicutes bacterium]|nr:DUF1292 domain-containing protein [Bacillota bacterium]